MGLEYGINNIQGKIEKNRAQKLLRYAYNLGIRTLDTAEVYGDAHIVIGNFHKNHSDKIFNIITKLPSKVEKGCIKRKIKNYLDDLNVEQLDTLMFHSIDAYNSNAENLKELLELKSKSLFRYLGVSVYTNKDIASLINDEVIDLIQLPFNLFDNYSYRGELLKRAKEKGKIIHTRSVFLQGLFFKDPEDKHPAVIPLNKQLIEIKELSTQYRIPLADMALMYCLEQKYVDNVLIGVDNTLQLQENLNATNKSIPKELIYRVNQITIENTNLLNPSLWN